LGKRKRTHFVQRFSSHDFALALIPQITAQGTCVLRRNFKEDSAVKRNDLPELLVHLWPFKIAAKGIPAIIGAIVLVTLLLLVLFAGDYTVFVGKLLAPLSRISL
jgi:hypothetical protein